MMAIHMFDNGCNSDRAVVWRWVSREETAGSSVGRCTYTYVAQCFNLWMITAR